MLSSPRYPFLGKGISKLLLALLSLALTQPALAQVDLPCSGEFTKVSPDSLNPVFAAIFELSVDWDLAALRPVWNHDSLRVFADAIIDEWPDNNEDLLNRLVDFFSTDLDDSYEGVTVPALVGTYDHFHICLREAAGNIYSAANRVELAAVAAVAPDEERTLAAAELAREGFAHEWQHVTYDRIATGPKFNGEIGTNEFLSKCAEYLAGMDRLWPVHDTPYERAYLGGRDYYGECIAGDHAEHKYSSFALFGAYLIEHFPGEREGVEDDLLHRWLNFSYKDPFGNILYKISPESLAELLAKEMYDHHFVGVEGPARLEELFHDFALSLWVNSSALAGPATLWAGGRLPQEHYQLFRNVNGLDCADDARSLPLHITVGEETVAVEGPLYPPDIYQGNPLACESGYESRDFPRYPKISTYGSSYLPITAAPELPADRCSDLLVELSLADRIYCADIGQEIPVEGSPNLQLNVSVLGYPTARDSLDLRGAEAVELSRHVLPLDELPALHSFRASCFGSAWQSVVFVLSVTELIPSQGYVWNRIIPFSYTARAVPASSPESIETDEIWGGEGISICLDGDLEVAQNASLTLLPGTQVKALGEEIAIEIAGELRVLGNNTSPVTIGAPGPRPLSWGEIEVEEEGRLEIRHAEIDGIHELSGRPGSILDLYEVLWQGGPRSAVIEVMGEGSLLRRLDLRNAGRVQMAAGRLDSSTLRAAQLSDGPLLLLEGEVERCSYLRLSNAKRGIQVSAEHAFLGPEVELKGAAGFQGRPWGLHLTEGGRLNATGLTIRGFDRGIISEDGASLFMRASLIAGCELGLLIEADAGVTDIGSYDFGGSGWGRNNFYGGEGLPPLMAVDNRSPMPCLAQWNYWGSSFPMPGLFGGNVNWRPYSTEPIDGGGLGGRRSPALSASVKLIAASPNPFNPKLVFQFEVSGERQRVLLSIYDIAGRRVALAVDSDYSPGRHQAPWEARDQRGRPLPSGVYFARIAGQTTSAKLVLLR